MTRDDIIRMAREAGISKTHAEGMRGFLERFAALVAAAEREACAVAGGAAAMAGLSHDAVAAAIRARGKE